MTEITIFDDLESNDPEQIKVLSEGEIQHASGGWVPLFVAGVAIGLAIGSRIWPQ